MVYVLNFFGLIPLSLNRFLGTIIGYFIWVGKSRAKKNIYKNIHLCFPEMGTTEKSTLIKSCCLETGKSIAEVGWVWCNELEYNKKFIIQENGMRFLQDDGPIIVLMPHFGCWELCARMVSVSTPITMLYKAPTNPEQAKLLLSLRSIGQLSFANATNGGVVALSRVLKKNGSIGILPDQDPGKGGEMVPFYENDARTMTLLVKMARNYDAKIVIASCERIKGGYSLRIRPCSIIKDTMEKSLLSMNREIENLVNTSPEQYLWSYDRFKMN